MELGPASLTPRETELLHEGDACDIFRQGTRVWMQQLGPWTAAQTRLAKKHRVTFAFVSDHSFGKRRDAKFLLELPDLRELHLVLARPLDLSAVAQLEKLEYLGIRGPSGPPAGEWNESIEWSALRKLKHANITLSPVTRGVLECASIETLELWDDFEWTLRALSLPRLTALRSLRLAACPKLAKVDLTHQPSLEALRLETIPKLKALELHTKAEVRSLALGGCGAYRIDWDRMGGHLRELELIGPIRFPLEDVLRAPNLHVLKTSSVRKFPPLKFLLQLKDLNTFDYWTTPPNPKWSEEDREVMRAINDRASTIRSRPR